jgi:hypothetical protein
MRKEHSFVFQGCSGFSCQVRSVMSPMSSRLRLKGLRNTTKRGCSAVAQRQSI